MLMCDGNLLSDESQTKVTELIAALARAHTRDGTVLAAPLPLLLNEEPEDVAAFLDTVVCRHDAFGPLRAP